MKLINDLNANQHEIQNAVDQNLNIAPSSPIEGQFYWNTVTKKDMIFDGTNWVDRTSQGRTYLSGNGITVDNTNNTIAIDTTVVAEVSDIPVVNNATITIQKNSTTIDSFTANQSSNKTINISVPTQATDVNALPDTTKYGSSISVSLNTTTYVLTISLKDQDGNVLGTAQTVDFPIESVVVNGSYDSVNKKIVLTLQNGNTIDVPVGDLINGLQTEITSSNQLDADLVDDTTASHKFVTNAQRTQIGTNATNIGNIQSTLSGYGDIVTHNASEFTKRIAVSNPALTLPSGGATVTWSISNTLGTENVSLSCYEISTGDIVYPDFRVTSSTITVKIGATANIPADTYKVVAVG